MVEHPQVYPEDSPRRLSRSDLIRFKFFRGENSHPLPIEQETTKIQTEENSENNQSQVHAASTPTRRQVLAAATLNLGIFLFDRYAPRRFQLPGKDPKQDPHIFDPIEGKPITNAKTYERIEAGRVTKTQVDFFAHRTGNSRENTEKIAELGINPDSDLVRVPGLWGDIYVYHGNPAYIPVVGIVWGGYDRDSNYARVFSRPPTFEEYINYAASRGVKTLIAELKRGKFTISDIRKMRDITASNGVSLILNSNSLDDVKNAALATEDKNACYFRTDKDTDIERASSEGYALFTSFDSIIRNRYVLTRNNTSVMIGGVPSRDQYERLQRLGINAKGFFDKAATIQEVLGEDSS